MNVLVNNRRDRESLLLNLDMTYIKNAECVLNLDSRYRQLSDIIFNSYVNDCYNVYKTKKETSLKNKEYESILVQVEWLRTKTQRLHSSVVRALVL